MPSYCCRRALLLLAVLTIEFVVPLRSAWSQATKGVPIDATGPLEVRVADDFANQRAEIYYYFEDQKTGQRYRLNFANTVPPALRSERVRVRGVAVSDEIVVGTTSDGAADIEIIGTPERLVSGNQPTIVMIINFTNATVSSSVATISNLVFATVGQSMNTCYLESSYGNVSWSGKVVGPYTLNYSSSGCDPDGWANAADAAATAAGEVLSLYTHKVYVVPNNTCGWCGLGTIGGNPSRAWVGCYDNGSVFAHEAGHNLGMGHSSNGPNNYGYVEAEYGDNSDFMGAPFDWRHNNAPHKEQMGWVPPGKIASVISSGTYQLGPLEVNPTNTPFMQLIKIAVPGSPYGYYLSYRRAIGFDATLSSAWYDRLNIHRYTSGSANPLFITALADNKTYHDSTTGLVFRQVSHDANSCTFTVAFASASSLPQPWRSTDVGNVTLGGWPTNSSGVWTVNGSGADIWDTSDSFRYTYLTLVGNGEIRARITSQDNTDLWAKSGVMVRESLNPNSKQALFCVTPGNGFALQYRNATGGTSVNVGGGPLNAVPNNWVRFVRTGNNIVASKSSNGTAWTVVGSATIPMNRNVYAGVAVCSHNNNLLNTTSFDNAALIGIGAGTGLTGEYYSNIDFTGTRLTRIDPRVNFNWDTGSPWPSSPSNRFSVRWTGQVEAIFNETYTFYTRTDDGVRLWIDGQLLVDKWVDQGPTEWSGAITLIGNRKYNVRMDYYENGGGAAAQLSWSSASQAKEIIPQAQLFASTNRPPVWTSNPFSKPNANAGQLYSSSIATNATDPDNDTLTFSQISGPAWLTVAANGGLSGAAANSDAGTNTFVVRATEPGGLFSNATLYVYVNGAPAFTSNPFSKSDATAGQSYSDSIAGNASDPNPGDTLSFIKLSGPAWLSVGSNGTLSGMPLSAQVGTNTLLVRVSDPAGLYGDATLGIRVLPAAPIIAQASAQGTDLVLSWSGGIGPYQVQMATNLAGGPWENLTGSLMTNVLAITRTNSSAFYRIVGQ